MLIVWFCLDFGLFYFKVFVSGLEKEGHLKETLPAPPKGSFVEVFSSIKPIKKHPSGAGICFDCSRFLLGKSKRLQRCPARTPRSFSQQRRTRLPKSADVCFVPSWKPNTLQLPLPSDGFQYLAVSKMLLKGLGTRQPFGKIFCFSMFQQYVPLKKS